MSKEEKYVCQLYVDNDLFKVVKFPRLLPKIALALQPVANIVQIMEEGNLSMATLPPKLVFKYSGVVQQKGATFIVRYDFEGIE